jgi:S1-C subfamily serine protease
MSEVPGSRAPAIAIGCAAAALLTSLIAVVVVVTRSPSAPAAALAESSIPASELAKLRRDAVVAASADGKALGVRVVDAKLRGALGLDEDDVITNLAGRTVETAADVHEAMLGAAKLGVSIVHVDVMRGSEMRRMRWQVAGDLRAASRRLDDSASSSAKPNPSDSGSVAGRDPLLDTIRKVDEFHFIVPRSTVERIVANIDDFAKGARVVPAMKGGLPEGFKVYAVRPTSLFAAIGLQNGDTIRAINGNETTSLDKVMEAYLKVKDAKELALDITRRGRYELISITIL